MFVIVRFNSKLFFHLLEKEEIVMKAFHFNHKERAEGKEKVKVYLMLRFPASLFIKCHSSTTTSEKEF